MPEYKAPGVYVEETSVRPPAVAEVETAIPAFIGYTEKAAVDAPLDRILKPTRINSLADYERIFGGPNVQFDPFEIAVADAPGGRFKLGQLQQPSLDYLLYYSIKMFYSNGGGDCYIVSVGSYQSTAVLDLTGDTTTNEATRYGLADGLDATGKVDEPTLLVIPEAVNLSVTDYQTLVQAALLQCEKRQDRFAIFDIYGGDRRLDPAELSSVRGLFGNDSLSYAAAYYPFIQTTLNHELSATEDNVSVRHGSAPDTNLGTLKSSNPALYAFVKRVIKKQFVALPAAAAVAGAYAANDRNRGVWKAPANVSLRSVIEPVVRIDSSYSKTLNVDAIGGKSINPIRAFTGRGILIWGARTLAGNDNEWRYVPVRRFFNTVEESVKKSTAWAVFEPNNHNTWLRLKNQVENYLTEKWRDGALQGSKPDDAFFVKVGLGSTMTDQDILENRMNIEIGMAVVRPAEFIIFRITHRLPTP